MRAVGVARTLRIGHGARRVEEPAQWIAVDAVGNDELRKGGGVALGEIGGGDEHLDGEVGGRLLRQLLVVDTAEHAGHDHQSALALLRDERELAVAVDREDRVLDRSEAGERADEHECLEARRQHPRHTRALGDATRREPGGGPLAPRPVLGVRHGATLLVDRHASVGGERGALLDELPQRLVATVDVDGRDVIGSRRYAAVIASLVRRR